MDSLLSLILLKTLKLKGLVQMACVGCGKKYPGSTMRKVTVTVPSSQPKAPVVGRYVIRPVVPPQVKPSAFPIGTKK